QSSLPLLLPHFRFTDPPTTETYTLSLHDALPICHAAVLRNRPERHLALPPQRRPAGQRTRLLRRHAVDRLVRRRRRLRLHRSGRSEEHTSELQSLAYLVCRLLLEKKKK